MINVYNETIDVSSGPTEAPAITDVIVNFSVYSPAGAGNLNHGTAMANITGDTTRTNSTCFNMVASGDYANYTCNITMWWWDGAGTWNIIAYIEDDQTNSVMNTSTSFFVGERAAFVMSPSVLTWPGIAPGSTNQTSNNDPLLLNNTGNDIIVALGIEINSSNLRGETNSTQALWAGNFSVSWDEGSAPPAECGGTVMSRSSLEGIDTANLTKGNYTANDGTAQERLYFCLKLTGTELSSQSYSTANETEWPWIVKISS